MEVFIERKKEMKINLKRVTPATWTRLIVLVIALINQVAISFFDTPIISIGDEELYESVSTIVTAAAAIYAAWKNNSLTEPAQNADEVMRLEKKNINIK